MRRKIVEAQLKNKLGGLPFQTSRLTEPWWVAWAYWRSTECPEQTHILMGNGYMMELSLRRDELSCNNWLSIWENKNQIPNAGYHKNQFQMDGDLKWNAKLLTILEETMDYFYDLG